MEISERRNQVLEFASRGAVRNLWYSSIVTFFFLLILTPTVFVLFYALWDWDSIETNVFSNPEVLKQIVDAIFLSVGVSTAVAFVGLIFALPLAWYLARRSGGRGRDFLNTIVESPLAVPTAGLGFSVALFWSVVPDIASRPFGSLGFVTDVFLLLVLFHFTTSFSYMVRALAAILEEIEVVYETAALSCGASRLTAARTVTLPLFRSGLATGLVLTFAKSLSDTGGVMAVLAAIKSDQLNGTALIGTWKGLSNDDPTLVPALAFVSMLMIIIAIGLMFTVRQFITRAKLPIKTIWPVWEKKLSKKKPVAARDFIAFLFLALFVLIPSFFIFSYVIGSPFQAPQEWDVFLNAILFSLLVAGIATGLNLLLGIPMGVLIVRGKNKTLSRILDTVVDIPYTVPSAALGFSVFLFWDSLGMIGEQTQLFLVILSHTAMTFPFVVRNVVGGLRDLDIGPEESARTHGARPIQVFRRITLPTISAPILAGAIMGFTRSVGETGATLAVSSESITAPVFIVNLIRSGDYYQASLATFTLILITSLLLLLIRQIYSRKS